MFKNTLHKPLIVMGLAAAFAFSVSPVQAATYDIDPGHSFVEFKISHLGYSVLKGRFNTMSGIFEYDEKNLKSASIQVEVEAKSIDSNHAKRDIHLRGSDFLDVDRYPTATFKSVSFEETGKNGVMEGDLTLHGVTKRVKVPITFIGAGPDPWGGDRRGYEGSLQIKRSDYGISYSLGPAAENMTLDLFIEGIRRK